MQRFVRVLCTPLLLSVTVTSLPTCNIADNQYDAYTVCGAKILDPDTVGLYMDDRCQSSECLSGIAKIEVDNPIECLYAETYRLYADNLTPLKAHCDALKNGTTNTSAPVPTTFPPRTLLPTTLPSPASTPTMISAKHASHSTQWIFIALAGVGVVAIIVVWRLRRTAWSVNKLNTAIETPLVTNTKTASAENNAVVEGNLALATEAHHTMEARLEQDPILERWRLRDAILTDQRFIGCGSHAFVHLVALPNGRQLASKRLAMDQITLPHLTQLIGEVHIVSKLRHESIVEFVGVAWTSATDFQALFEYMKGGDLRRYLSLHKPTEEDETNESMWSPHQLRIARTVAEGLAYTHSFNPPLVHRDLKSHNILLTKDLHAKISDFGAARYQSENCTMTTGIGTNRWLAPEVIAGGGTYTDACDIYSFGVVLTELDTYDIPLAHEMEEAQQQGTIPSELWLLHAIAIGQLRPSLSRSCPSMIRDLAMSCLAFDPKARPNALEVSYRLRAIIKSTASSS